MNLPAEGRARPAWLASIAIHAALVAAVAWWLVDRLEPASAPPRPTPINLAMFQAPSPPVAEAEPAPAPAPPFPEPSLPEPVVEPPPPPAPPAPQSIAKPQPKPMARPPKPRPAKAEASPPVEATPVRPEQTAPAVTAPVQAPAPATPPAPSPLVPAIDPALEEVYRARIRQAVDAHKHYPRLARRMGEEGTVLMAFTIGPDGRLLGVRVLEGSGSELLDEAALQAVRDAVPFPAFPAGTQRTRWEFTLPLTFSLGG